MSTLIKLAKCREHEGKLAEAWYTLRQALKLNRELTTQTPRRREELESFARAEFAALEPRVPRLRIQVPSAPSGLTLMRDGKAIPTSALGEALAVDPGEHELIAAAPGFRGEKRRVSVQEGETIEVAFQLVAELPTAIAPRRARPDAQLAADADGDASSSSQRRTAGFIVGGVGAAGILAGGVLGGFTLARAGGAAADESGNADRAAARSTQTAAFVAAGIGAAALATGVVLVITAGSSETSPPAVTATVGPARASLRAVW